MPSVQRLRPNHLLLTRVKGVPCADQVPRPNPFETKGALCYPLKHVPETVGAGLVETVRSNPARENSCRVIPSPPYRTADLTASNPKAASYRDPVATDADFQQIYIKKLEQELANCKAQLNEKSEESGTHRAINSSAAPGVTSRPYVSNPSTTGPHGESDFGLPYWVADPRRAKVRVQPSLSTSKGTDWSDEETCSGLKRKCSDLRCRRCIKIDRHVVPIEKGNKHHSKRKISHSGSQRLSNDRGNDLQCNCQSDFSKCSPGADTRSRKVRPTERDKSAHRRCDHTSPRQNHSSVKHRFEYQGHKKDKASKSKDSKNISVEMIGQKRGFADSDVEPGFVHRKSAIQNAVGSTLSPSRIAGEMAHVYKPIQDDLNSLYMRRNSAIEGEANSTLCRRLQNLQYAEDIDSVILDDQASYKTVVPSPISLSHKRKSACCA